MLSIAAFLLLAFVVQTIAAHSEGTGRGDSQDLSRSTDESVNRMVDELIGRTSQGLRKHRSDLEDTVLGKHAQLRIPQATNLRPLLPVHSRNNNAVNAHASRTRTFAANVDATVADPRKTGMALMLDDGTRKSHSMAENSAFVSGFFRGLCEKKNFAQLVSDLYFVYLAMESAFDATKDANVNALDYPQLRRVPSLEKDMDFYYGDDWRTTVKPSAATAKYVARVEEVAREQPELLIAHQYTRYLGDLFGGQMMSGMATTSLDLPEGKGIAFYKFEDIPGVKEFITEWYSKLNSLQLTEGEKNAIVDEANLVFRLNIELFDELEGNPIIPAFRLALESLKEKLGLK